MRKTTLVLIATLATLIGLMLADFGSAQLGLPKKKPSGSTENTASRPYPPCNGPKKRIAIYRFKDGTNGSQGFYAIREGMDEALQHELVQTGCFVVLVTNDDLGDAAAEIGHGQSGMAAEGKQPEAGKQLGAQAIFQGTVLEVAFKQSQGVGIGGVPLPKAVGSVGGGLQSTNAKISLIIKMYDPETRVIEFSEKAEGQLNKMSVRVDSWVKGVTVNGKLSKATPLGEAALMAIHDAVYVILSKMNSMPWQATVLKAEGGQVIIRAGADSGLGVGQVLNVYKPGEFIEDPDTGEKLRLPATRLGQVKVTQITDKFTFASIVSGPVIMGNWVRLE